ncbi:ABC transporter ATP-binding protein [Pseudorhodoferax sp. Leaf267]|uniref:ABC transporter ATP-binding protein n=1 Tax=Pseudorhodoferax sp. Leaf267 TaxID=1736316 RepID=UPI0006F2541A|nr:ATP-binding cassette domain-containing protein [Pseudorhodoferax sp. Leaf267]KQP22998.1 ABC transporter ATP-binding protein [Pseudorhodoferax sp. Leaf267]
MSQARIDVALRLSVADGQRRFNLSARFATDAGVVALYGPSGSGKSLSLQAMAGLLRPDAGHVRIAGRTLFDAQAGVDLPPRARRIGYLFQHYALFPHLSVRENVAFGLTSWRQRRLSAGQSAQVDGLLHSFGLSAMADSRPATLSGGQQQRVALARALACRPELLLLDEPFAALNPMLRDELRGELQQVCRSAGVPAVMITHDVEDVLALAEVCFVYEEGHVVRAVDLRDATHRDLAREALTGLQPAPLSPLRQRMQRLLSGQAVE